MICIIVPKMNCGSKSGGHKYSTYNRLCIEILHFVSWLATVSLSHIRENLLKMWNASSIYISIYVNIYIYIFIYLEIVWPYCVNTVDVLGFRRHKFPRTLQVFMEIQKFLVLFCRYESPRTRAHLLGRIHKPIDFLLPCTYGSIRNSSHAQYCSGEYVGFCCRQLNCSVCQASFSKNFVANR